MESLISLSEVARNLALPAVAVLGALIALWQAQMGKRRNGNDLLAKAAEMIASANESTKLAAYALMVEAFKNSATREMASRLLWSYISAEENEKMLRDVIRLAHGTSILAWVQWRLDAVSRGNDGKAEHE